MSVLNAEDFDREIERVSEDLFEIIWTFREGELDSVLKALDESDMSRFSEDEIYSLLEELQEGLLTSDEESKEIDDLFSTEQLATAIASYEESAKTYELDIEKDILNLDFEEGSTEQSLMELAGTTTSGEFAKERDKALSKRVSRRVAKILSGTNKAEKQDPKEKALSAIRSAWGEKNTLAYCTVSCSAWMTRARTIGQILAFDKAGFEKMRIVAEIDQRTTHICRLLHGKTIVLSDAKQRLEREIIPSSTSNWLLETNGPKDKNDIEDNRPHIYLPADPGKEPTLIAVRTENYFETSNGLEFDMGSYTQNISDEKLGELLGPPPYHILCRSIIVPVEWEDDSGFRADVTITEE